VLAGKVQVTVGDHVNTLSAGDSLHFNSGIPHQLRSISDERAELIVVIYTP
jgi:quercetin dioxygenase-like cupin family protein